MIKLQKTTIESERIENMFEIAISFVMQIVDLIKNLFGAFSENEV